MIWTLILYAQVGTAFDELPRRPVTPTPNSQAEQDQRPAQVTRPFRPAEQNKPYSTNYQARCERPADHEEADLCQQWRSAQAAEEMVVGTFISIAGLALSLIFTGWAAIAASQAARAAIGMNELTAALEQPLLGVKMPAGKQEFTESGFKNTPIKFLVINMGRTPAKITAIHRCWELSCDDTFPSPIDPSHPTTKGLLKADHRYVAGESKTEGIWSKESQLSRFSDKMPKRIFFQGFIKFEDMNRRRFVAGFCYFIDPSGDREFGMAWPAKNVDLYNYCRPEEDKPSAA